VVLVEDNNEMFEVVEKIKTLDGALFDTKEQAENYIVDKVSEEINEWIKKAPITDLKHRDLVTILTALAGNEANLKRLHRLITKYVS
jgi:hypothetical protein